MDHPHEHTTHALRDVIEALPRYDQIAGEMETIDRGMWLKLEDVRAVIHKAAVLGAPVAHDKGVEMEDNNPHFKVTREEFKSDDRAKFLAKIDRGKGISMAREAGMELVDQDRMVALLTDLTKEGLLDTEDGETRVRIAVRAMAILRG